MKNINSAREESLRNKEELANLFETLRDDQKATILTFARFLAAENEVRNIEMMFGEESAQQVHHAPKLTVISGKK